MTLPDDQLDELKKFYPAAACAKEAGITYVLLPKAALPIGCDPPNVDLLLCPAARDGYPSRLYFSTQVESPKQLNWNGSTRVLERNWFAYSWKIEPSIRLAQMVQAHLQAFR
jgi:hypothetical protein